VNDPEAGVFRRALLHTNSPASQNRDHHLINPNSISFFIRSSCPSWRNCNCVVTFVMFVVIDVKSL
jgi:hypothetical protein